MTASQDEIEQFVVDNHIDERAAGLLRSAPDYVRRLVLEQGSLVGCRDPSASCVGRIRKAQPPGAHPDVEQFVSENNLQPRAANALRAASTQAQQYVLDQGSLQTCRDPNAGCMGRLKRAQAGESAPPLLFIPPSRDEVEAFIEANELNERAADALRGAPPAVQRQVIDQGSLLSCREPSAGCIGRIGKAHKQLDPALLAIPHTQGPSAEEVEEFILENGLDDRAAVALRSAVQWVQRQVLDQGSLRSCRDPNAGLMGRLNRAQIAPQQLQALMPAANTPAVHTPCLPASSAAEVEAFIWENGLNERAADALRSVGPAVQRKVLEQGSLQGTREPSAACIGRIGKLQKSSAEPGRWQEPFRGAENEVEQFILDNALDQSSSAILRSCSPDVQQLVLEQGSLASCREPSAGCVGRIRRAEAALGRAPAGHFVQSPPSGHLMGGGSGHEAWPDVETFIVQNQLNERAADALREVDPEIQMQVISQGSLASCREPSAGCIGRIAKAQSVQKFAPTQVPRMPITSVQEVQLNHEAVEQFIVENGLNERAADALRTVPPFVQEQVLEQGPLQGCREPSASCIGRIAKAQRGTVVGQSFHAPTADELTAFVQENVLSERASAALNEALPIIQRAVLDQGSLRGCREPSAGCMGRIKKATLAMRDGTLQADVQSSMRGTKRPYEAWQASQGRNLRAEVERFVAEHSLSERAASILREEQPEVQDMVLQGGSLHGTRDMSASCVGRIRKAQQELSDRPAKWSRGSLSEAVRMVGSSMARGGFGQQWG
ncbi:unnamed protein product [Effrenium voratum]|nr:unnamed protein product [Effrenium voratum]